MKKFNSHDLIDATCLTTCTQTLAHMFGQVWIDLRLKLACASLEGTFGSATLLAQNVYGSSYLLCIWSEDKKSFISFCTGEESDEVSTQGILGTLPGLRDLVHEVLDNWDVNKMTPAEDIQLA